MTPAPVLVLAAGNPSRGDDALGPTVVEMLERRLRGTCSAEAVESLVEYQFQIEHALDLAGRRCVVFVDASLSAASPCTLERLTPGRTGSFTSHALAPQDVLAVCRDIGVGLPESAWLLAVRGVAYELGAGLTPAARAHAGVAAEMLADLVTREAGRHRLGEVATATPRTPSARLG